MNKHIASNFLLARGKWAAAQEEYIIAKQAIYDVLYDRITTQINCAADKKLPRPNKNMWHPLAADRIRAVCGLEFEWFKDKNNYEIELFVDLLTKPIVEHWKFAYGHFPDESYRYQHERLPAVDDNLLS